MYARVAVLTERGALAQTYTYELPSEHAEAGVGTCLLVPFQTQLRLGYIVELMETADVPAVKAALGRCRSGDLPAHRVELAQWMADRWFTSVGPCLRLMIPPAVRGRILRRVCATNAAPVEGVPPKALEILTDLRSRGPTPLQTLYRTFGKPAAQRALTQLRKLGLVTEEVELSQGEAAPRTETYYELAPGADVDKWLASGGRRRQRQTAVLQLLSERDEPVTRGDLLQMWPSAAPAIKSLLEDGMLVAREQGVRRQAREPGSSQHSWELTEHQAQSLARVQGCLELGQHREILLFGVTASGKTEVYLRAVEQVLQAGRGALVLMPEIALTVHAVSQYRGRFGDMLAVLHSRLSAGERADEWRRIESGQARVVLGPRSAVFAPLDDPGIIILDEEHEPAFKQESDPRYHARDVCREIARRRNIPLVLGSATPSVESFRRAIEGASELCEMPLRIDDRPVPQVKIVDMSALAREGTLAVFGPDLAEHLMLNLKAGGQSIVFLNRRAYGTFVLCRECGYVANCPNCAVTVKFHRGDQSIRCHHCDWRAKSPDVCPQCGGARIASFGIGTQRVEEELQRMLPEARLLRMDRDTTSGKDSLVELLEQFRARQADILIGTQMVAKGLDFPGVLVVGVINADTGLYMPDFRAAERGFQLLTQVAGRAGRGDTPGTVLFQTFQPEHYAVQAAAKHDYRSFYEMETALREESGWPPFSSVARILAQRPTSAEARASVEAAAAALARDRTIEVIGPSPAPIERIKSRSRWHMLVRGADRATVIEALRRASVSQAELQVDIDPLNLL